MTAGTPSPEIPHFGEDRSADMQAAFDGENRRRSFSLAGEASSLLIPAPRDALTEERLLAPYELPDYEPIHLNGGVFTEPRQYGVYDRSAYMPKLERVCNALSASGVVPIEALDQTMSFAERAFDVYEGKTKLDNPGSHVFIIPTFVSSWHTKGEYNSEIQTSYPISRYVDSKTLVDTVTGVPPLVIESYPVDDDGKQAHVLFAPVMPDMFVDLGFSDAMKTSAKVINDTVRFARDRVGAKVAGLGAILPSAVGLGEKIDVEGIRPTTGHGGTVDLVARTVGKVIEARGLANNTIGVVGAAGSIGRSSLTTLLRQYPNAQFVVNDTRFVEAKGGPVSPKSAEKYLSGFEASERGRIAVAATLDEVFSRAKVNVSAITDTVDVEREVSIDMDNVVIVDDSQPGAFERNALEQRGGRLVWVVGQDVTADGRLTRMGDFKYGDNGLYRRHDVFGCEAEAFVVYRSGNYDNAVTGRVDPEKQMRIGRLFTEHGIDVSDTFQSDGRPVDL